MSSRHDYLNIIFYIIDVIDNNNNYTFTIIIFHVWIFSFVKGKFNFLQRKSWHWQMAKFEKLQLHLREVALHIFYTYSKWCWTPSFIVFVITSDREIQKIIDVSIVLCKLYSIFNLKWNIWYMEASKPKCVNSNYIWYGVNSLRLGGLHIKVHVLGSWDYLPITLDSTRVICYDVNYRILSPGSLGWSWFSLFLK